MTASNSPAARAGGGRPGSSIPAAVSFPGAASGSGRACAAPGVDVPPSVTPGDLDLDAIEARAAAATAPSSGSSSWLVERFGLGYTVFTGPLSDDSSDITGSIYRPEDADFIAAARTDVPLLVAEVRRLTAELDNARARLEAGLR